MQPKIYQLRPQDFKDNNDLKELLYANMSNDYYWSNDWSEEFYIELVKMGFINTSFDTKEGLVLLPELQFEYGLLDFENLHVSKKVKKLLQKDDATLYFNSRFDEVIAKFSTQHKNNWLKNEYAELIKNLYKNRETTRNFELICIELISKESDELIAGELGYIIGKTYTSLSGFSSKEKKYNNYGTLQLVLLAKHLQKEGFDFWNLGHPHMEYKHRLGSFTYSREDFLHRWERSIKYFIF